MVDGLLRGPLREHFCTELTVGPEATHRGAILIIDLPVKEYGEVGQIAQAIWKYAWQKATDRRVVEGNRTRPVFLWVDEAQHFITTNDMLFQTTARSVRACTVFLTQSYANYQAVLGAGDGKAVTDSLLGNLSTKIWHANGDGTTNQHASELIGMKWDVVANFSRGPASGGSPDFPFRNREQATTAGGSMQRVFRVEPVEFTRLKTGGPRNGRVVEAIIFKHGRSWKGGANYLRAEFAQR
jgi:type IV secretory pathway TraG/TraD family ATPase VirD4